MVHKCQASSIIFVHLFYLAWFAYFSVEEIWEKCMLGPCPFLIQYLWETISNLIWPNSYKSYLYMTFSWIKIQVFLPPHTFTFFFRTFFFMCYLCSALDSHNDSALRFFSRHLKLIQSSKFFSFLFPPDQISLQSMWCSTALTLTHSPPFLKWSLHKNQAIWLSPKSINISFNLCTMTYL